MPHKPLILCIDDELRPLVVRRLLLESEGYKVITASTAEEALDCVGTNSVNLIITDQLLVKTTGIELAAKLKKLRPSVPILLLTGLIELPKSDPNIDITMSKLDGPEAFLALVGTLLPAHIRRAS
jgi:two-component system, OmpR family, response regulator CpxR